MGASPQTFGVAVVGLGVGEQHARAYLRDGSCRLTWLHDLDSARADRLAAELGQGRPATSYEEILADPAVDIVSIATYDADHFGQVMAALRAGKHVFVEKPLCRTRAEAAQIRQAWLEAGGPRRAVASNLVLRQAPLYRRLRESLQGGLLGRIYALDGEYLYGRLPKITEGWRGREQNYSAMAGGGVHMVDLALWLTGLRPESLTAVGNRICTAGTAFAYNDFVAATAVMEGGAVARFTANFGCVHRHQHVLRIYGTEGTFLYDDAGARLHLSRDPSTRPEFWSDDPLPATKGDCIPGFLRGIREGRDWAREVQTALDVTMVCAACDEALKGRHTVQMEYA